MLIATYTAPNVKHYALNRIEFHKKGRKITAKLLNTKAGLTLNCTSPVFVKRASKMAIAYYTKV